MRPISLIFLFLCSLHDAPPFLPLWFLLHLINSRWASPFRFLPVDTPTHTYTQHHFFLSFRLASMASFPAVGLSSLMQLYVSHAMHALRRHAQLSAGYFRIPNKKHNHRGPLVETSTDFVSFIFSLAIATPLSLYSNHLSLSSGSPLSFSVTRHRNQRMQSTVSVPATVQREFEI